MKKILLLLAFAAILSVSTVHGAEFDEGVVVLTDDNFDEELAKHEYLLVEFYAPWCGHCKKLAPEYAKAAQKLAQNTPPYYIAKVDATEHKKVSERFGVKGFPTLYFFKKGVKTEYTGGRTEQDIVNWILKKVGPPSNEVTAEQLKTKVDENKLVVAYFGDVEAKEYKDVFLEVATNPTVGDKYQFFHINDEATAKSYGATKLPAIVLFRKFDESPLVYSGSYETTPVVDFLVSSSVPTLIDFSEDYIEPIFGQRKAALFLFRDPEDSNADFVKTFSEAAGKLKGEILFVVSGIKDGIQNRLAEFVGVDASSLPTIRILNPQDNMRKYTFPGDVKGLKFDEVKQFVQDFKDKKLVAALKSQEIPETNDEPVKIVVGKSFKDFVGKDSDVLLEFYAPWCGHCKKLAPLYDELATELKDVKNLVIAKMDSTVNEVEGIDIRGYPTIKFFPAGSDKGIDYEGDRDVAGFKKYLSEKSTSYKKHLESASAAKEGEL